MGERPSHDLDRLTVAEAAAALNVSQDAIRKRIARGTIAYDRDESGRGHVYVSPSETVHKTDQDTASKTDQDVYIRSLEDQIRFLREELERTHVVLRNLTERIPELEAPQESPETVEQTSEGARPHPSTEEPQERVQEPQRRRWWEFWR